MSALLSNLLAYRRKGEELVERMERRELDVFGEAVLIGEPVFTHDAGLQRGRVHTLPFDD